MMSLRELLRRYQSTLQMLAALEPRALQSRLSPATTALEVRFGDALLPRMALLYTVALADGYTGMPEHSAHAITLWLLSRFAQHPEWAEDLITTLVAFIGDATELGVREGLELNGGPPLTELSDADLLEDIAERVATLTSVGRTPSLIHTTANELGHALYAALAEQGDRDSYVGALQRERTELRAIMIAATETVRALNVGRIAVFQRNKVSGAIVRTEVGACHICQPYAGKRFVLPPAITLPLHVHCRCFFVPDLSDWEPPAHWWTGA